MYQHAWQLRNPFRNLDGAVTAEGSPAPGFAVEFELTERGEALFAALRWNGRPVRADVWPLGNMSPTDLAALLLGKFSDLISLFVEFRDGGL